MGQTCRTSPLMMTEQARCDSGQWAEKLAHRKNPRADLDSKHLTMLRWEKTQQKMQGKRKREKEREKARGS